MARYNRYTHQLNQIEISPTPFPHNPGKPKRQRRKRKRIPVPGILLTTRMPTYVNVIIYTNLPTHNAIHGVEKPPAPTRRVRNDLEDLFQKKVSDHMETFSTQLENAEAAIISDILQTIDHPRDVLRILVSGFQTTLRYKIPSL